MSCYRAAAKLLCSQAKHFRKWNATIRNLSGQGWKTKRSSRKHLASWKRHPKTFCYPSMKMALNSKAGCNTEVFCYPDDCYTIMQVIPAELIGAIQEHWLVIDLPPAVKIMPPTPSQKHKIILQSNTCVGSGQNCFKPRRTDIWDRFPRNLAV